MIYVTKPKAEIKSKKQFDKNPNMW